MKEDESEFIDNFIKKEGENNPANLFANDTIEKFLREMVKRYTKEELQRDVIIMTKQQLLAQRLLYNKKTLNAEDTKQLCDIFGF